MSWTQPICSTCHARRSGCAPVRVSADFANAETCCDCGRQTADGIYMRLDPRTVKFPKEEK